MPRRPRARPHARFQYKLAAVLTSLEIEAYGTCDDDHEPQISGGSTCAGSYCISAFGKRTLPILQPV